jgi:precorrin-3B synthase
MASAQRSSTPATRGECPSVHQPFAEVDGALIRVRIPGGVLSAEKARQIAVAGQLGTTLELTSRANLQLRGVPEAAHDAVAGILVAAGVTDADAGRDSRRNVLASPTAGYDPTELMDVRPLVSVVERLLKDAKDGSLSPKFGVVIDGGGAVHVRGRTHDICLGAVQGDEGRVGLEVRLGSALPLGVRTQPALLLEPADVDAFVMTALEAVAAHPAAHGRISGLTGDLGEAATIRVLAEHAGCPVRQIDASTAGSAGGPSVRPIGILAAREPGTVMVGTMPVLGRLAAETLSAIAASADCWGDGTIRVTPWRSLLLTGVAGAHAAAVQAELENLGLLVHIADPAVDVVACAGSAGCPAGLVDTQRDGRLLVQTLWAAGQASGVPVHLSGCEKRCAAGDQEFALTLLGEEDGTYALVPHDEPTAIRRGLTPDDALGAAVAVHTRRTARRTGVMG